MHLKILTILDMIMEDNWQHFWFIVPNPNYETTKKNQWGMKQWQPQ